MQAEVCCKAVGFLRGSSTKQRLRAGGKWMQKSPAAPGGAFRSRPPRTFRTRGPVSQQTFQLQLPSGGAHATILTGKRLPRPNIERLRWVRSVKAAASASADRPTVVRQDVWEEDALSHNTGLQLLFLGTGTGHPAELRFGIRRQ